MSQEPTSIEDLARKVFSQRADVYVTSQTHTDPRVLGRMVELAQPQPHWGVLDVGTGTGHTAFALAPHVAEVVGVDLTPPMLAEAEALARSRGIDNVRWQEADVHSLPFADETFDLVTCRRAAHHFRDIETALAEMLRVLRPGRLLLLDDRSVPEDAFADATMNRLDWLHDESHVREYRSSEWQAMLETAGCQVVAIEPYIRRRPLRSLTDRVSQQNMAEIHAILQRMTPDQRRLFAVEQQGDELYCNHWYVTIAARKGVN